MNDHELDEMLNQWGVPPVGAELRGRVRAGFVGAPKRQRYFPSVGWKGMFAGVAAASVLVLVVCAEAFPDVLNTASPTLRPPYVAISSVVKYAKDGSSQPDGQIFSYSYKGTEIIQAEDHPGNPFLDAAMTFHIGVHRLMLEFAPNLVLPETAAKDAWFSAYVKAGCVDKGDVVIGHEKILTHETTVIQNTGLPRARPGDGYEGWRWTGWLAPDLGCFPLRTRNEELVSGAYRLTKQRDTVRVLTRRGDGRGWE